MMPFCKKCGIGIERPFKYCPECSFRPRGLSSPAGDEVYSKIGQLLRYGRGIEARLKAAADASGNPKIWTNREYDQDFLKSLIPGKM